MLDYWFISAAIAVVLASSMFIALTLLPAALIKRRLRQKLALAARGRLALTYDDGPGPKLTTPLLKVLREHDARATFYLVGFRAERFPDAADAIAAAGHEIGNHSHAHRHAWKAWPWRAVSDLHQGYQTMSRWMSGVATYRPPFGKLTTWTYLAAKKRRCMLSFWTTDGADTWPALPDPAMVARQVAAAGGGVVLLHSHDRGEDRQRYVLEVTKRLLETARQHGLQVCTMSEILHASEHHQPGRAFSEAGTQASSKQQNRVFDAATP
jgi:peptidoglycan/xylan/chitin deacetylase (PgdA/CDA1 family)